MLIFGINNLHSSKWIPWVNPGWSQNGLHHGTNLVNLVKCNRSMSRQALHCYICSKTFKPIHSSSLIHLIIAFIFILFMWLVWLDKQYMWRRMLMQQLLWLYSSFQGALLINIARGHLLDYEAVFRNLQSGHLGGLGTDVTWTEPFDPDDPILKFDNVIVTPHLAGVTEYSYRSMAKVKLWYFLFLFWPTVLLISMKFSFIAGCWGSCSATPCWDSLEDLDRIRICELILQATTDGILWVWEGMIVK